VRIVIAPDKFKESLDAVQVAESIATGARRVFPDAVVDVIPLADGGDGTGRALLAGLGGRTEAVDVTGPLGDRVTAEIVLLDDGRAVVEVATASGLALVEEDRRDPLAASSFGTGELVSAAAARGAGEVVVAVGGSASTDGGTGAAAAIGWSFLDRRGRRLPPGGGALRSLARIDSARVASSVTERTVVGACDVDNALLGEGGAAAVFGPQKGAGPREVAALEEGLERLAEVISADLGIDVAPEPRSGAGGGIGAGLIAFFGGELEPGFDVVAGAVGVHDAVRGADLVVTGEGRLDEGSLGGKTPVAVARLAARHGVPCVALAGELRLDPQRLEAAGLMGAVGLVETAGRERAVGDPAGAIADAAELLLGDFARSR
jgi:glycerate kinase